MLHNHLKQALRLNRTIGFIMLAVALLQGWVNHPTWLPLPVLTGILGGLAVFFALANQISLRLAKRLPEGDALVMEKISVLIPLVSIAVISVAYFVSGQLAFALFMLIPILEAHLFGRNHLAKGLAAFTAIAFAWSVLLGYPYAGPWGQSIPAAISSTFLALFAYILFDYGKIIAALVRSTTTQVTRLQSLAATDGLTGLINRRQFNHRLLSEISRARRHDLPLSLALFDIDDFKKLNDFYGHPVGDRILKELGALISINVRESDIPARYGGEEFALILPETRQVEAHELLERLRKLIEQTVFCLPDNPLTITISVGLAQLDREHHTAFQLVEQADAALYEAKRQGKNRVVYGVVPVPKISIPATNRFQAPHD